MFSWLFINHFFMSTFKVPERSPVREIHTDWIIDLFDKNILLVILESDSYQNCSTYREQCHFLWDYLNFFGWSKHKAARLFNVDHKSFEKQIRLPIEQRPPGQPNILNQDEIIMLVNEVKRLFDIGEFPTTNDLIQFIIENTQNVISFETLRNIMTSKGFKSIVGQPMDELRTSVADDDIENYYDDLAQTIDGSPASLVFNMDEAGEDDYVDTHPYHVFVPENFEKKNIKIPVRRGSKRSTLLHYISVDGTFLKSLMIVPRKTVDSRIFKKLTSNNVLIKSQEKGFSNTEIIKFWFDEIFFPHVEKVLDEEYKRSEYMGNAFLILDGLSCHAKAIQS